MRRKKMLNKITTIVFIKSEVKKGETDNGKTYHKVFCTSKDASGKGYIPYNFTLWGNRFDRVIPLLEKEKPVYIEADMLTPRAYINKKGDPAVDFQGYVTKIELLPRENKEETPKAESCKNQDLSADESLPF